MNKQADKKRLGRNKNKYGSADKKKQEAPIQTHWNHMTELRIGQSGPHVGHYYCLKCRKYIMWAKQKDVDKYRSGHPIPKPLRQFFW